jgi:hypothetical protein
MIFRPPDEEEINIVNEKTIEKNSEDDIDNKP